MLFASRSPTAYLVALSLTALLLAGCGGGKLSASPTAVSTSRASVSPTASARASGTPASATISATPAAGNASIPFATLDTFYPEFASSHLDVTQSIAPKISQRAGITVYNLTDMQLQPSAIQALYSVMDQLSQQQQVIPGPDNVPNDVVVVGPRNPTRVSMVLIPANAVKPRSTTSDFIKTRNPPADTAFSRSGELFTYVQVQPGLFSDGSFAAVPDFATFNFGVEICQELIQAKVADQQGTPITDTSLNTDAQEYVCNSLGGAIASKALGLTYDQYDAFAQSHPIRISNGDTSAIEVDEESYNAYPQTGPIIK